uniref:GDSL esterase/lipase n=1 Tax=Sedum alfredii TaxID=439688 RepID=A0A650AVF5_9MAGN|nr:GDSL esterase/lipase [Sedum alfredii]
MSPITLLMIVFISISMLISLTKVEALTKRNPSVPAVFVFGDSTVDPGNNNFIGTTFRSDFPPYGQDLPDHMPTGRFSDGRLVTDFVASYAGVKDFIPPYLNPELSLDELMTGVSFASAGSGFDPLTPQISSTLSLPEQLEYFREYKTRMTQKIGKKKTDELISKSVYVLSAGTNDFVVNYITLPLRRQSYSVSQFENFILQYLRQFIKALMIEGARKMAIGGLPPIGCLPIVITLYSKSNPLQRGCIDSYSAIARSYNKLLTKELTNMATQVSNHGIKLVYADIYNPVITMIQQHDRFGFEKVTSGCCGTGYLEASFLCNYKSWVCNNASKYVFFDSIHPTERTYYNVFMSLRPIIDYILKD